MSENVNTNATQSAPVAKKKLGVKARVQKFGSALSNMVMPNIGAFIAWGLITAIFMAGGWWPNAGLAKMIQPMVHYLLPLLIAFTGGTLFAGHRGGVVGAIATMGVIVGSSIPMFIGAMIMGPLGGWCIKKWDDAISDKIKSGFEMLVNNFSAGIIGMLLAILGYFAIGPLVAGASAAMAAAIFMAGGWWPNAGLAKMIQPMVHYLLPLLIAFTGGTLFAGHRGGVVGAIATMGVIVGSSIPMFIGAMIMGPLGGWCIKKWDDAISDKIKSGFEMLVNNFSAGIIGMLLAILGYFAIVHYLLPLLIAFTGGTLFAGHRGGVVGAIATMGVIVGSSIPMFIGAIIVGPLGGLCLEKWDDAISVKIKSGFEMLVNHFSAGIIGMLLAILGYFAIVHYLLPLLIAFTGVTLFACLRGAVVSEIDTVWVIGGSRSV
ncbi:hypothetical protein WP50_18180 [Lactiplantibacillus plantarum]|nr:hypothetical protein WP50_18180 [Lactiplantibacillus plantarum]